MISFLTFLAGAVFGGLGAVWALAITFAMKPTIQNQNNEGEKLAKALKRFGQTANRTSIGEARRIANAALKELK